MAREFDGNTANHLDVGDVAAIDITGDYLTVAFFFRWLGSGSTHFPVAKSGGTVTTVQYSCELLNTGVPTFAIGDGSDQDKVTGVTTLLNGRWYHYAGVKQGTGADALRIYLNGKIDALTTSNRSITNKAETLRFGMRQGGPGYVGAVAHVAIWDAALTSSELLALSKGASPHKIRPGSLKGYWPLNDYGTSGESRDKGSFNNTATMVGAVPLSATNPEAPGILIPRISPAEVPAVVPGFTDSAEIYYDIQPSGTDVYSQGFVDAAEIYYDIQVASVELLEAVDAASIYYDIQPSGVEVLEKLDAATIYYDIQPSGVDVQSFPCLILGDGEARLRWDSAGERLRWLAADADLRWEATLQLGTGEC